MYERIVSQYLNIPISRHLYILINQLILAVSTGDSDFAAALQVFHDVHHILLRLFHVF
jgi:hypothetical protein